MLTEEKKQFLKKLHAPEEAAPYIDYIFTKQEQDFILKLTDDTFSRNDILLILGEETDTFVKSAYRRGVLSWTDSNMDELKLSGFYERMDVMAVSEQEQYRKIPEAGRKMICSWLFDQYYQRLDPEPSVRPTEDVIMPLEQVLDYIDSKGDLPVYLNFCDCKSLNGECGKPRDTCITWKTGINTYSHRGLSRKIDPDTAKEIVRRADKAGLMHTVNSTGICNCCSDCCYLFRSQARRRSSGFWPKVDYRIQYDSEKCVSCGACVKRCWFQVFTKNEKTITLDTSKCVGCGICTGACPGNALQLISCHQ